MRVHHETGTGVTYTGPRDYGKERSLPFVQETPRRRSLDRRRCTKRNVVRNKGIDILSRVLKSPTSGNFKIVKHSGGGGSRRRDIGNEDVGGFCDIFPTWVGVLRPTESGRIEGLPTVRVPTVVPVPDPCLLFLLFLVTENR